MSKKGSKAILKAEEKLKEKIEARTQETYPTETRKPEPNILDGKPIPENPIEYVRFQSPCPPANKMEPVYELKTKQDDKRYQVDEIWEFQDKIYWTLNNQMSWSPLANVQYARPKT